MMNTYTHESVSSFHLLGKETVKQSLTTQNTTENKIETIGLKALADKVLYRNSTRNNHETEHKYIVSLSKAHETKLKADYYKNFFEERTGIAEFDGCQGREEAEAIAYKDTLSEWIYNHPPAGYEIRHCAYCGEAIDFSAGGYLAWGAVYCCYHSQDNEHLRPYLQSRIKEAKAYLKSIKINQPSCEA